VLTAEKQLIYNSRWFLQLQGKFYVSAQKVFCHAVPDAEENHNARLCVKELAKRAKNG